MPKDIDSGTYTLDDLFVYKRDDLALQVIDPARSLLDEEIPRMHFTPLQPLKRPSALSPSKALASTPPKADSEAYPVVAGTESSTAKIKIQDPKRSGKKDKEKGKTLEIPVLPALSASPITHQTKGDKQPGNPDPAQQFLTGVKTSFKRLMTGLQGFPGEILVQAEFGRIILRKINSRYVTSNDNLESFPSQEILTQLLPNPEKDGNEVRTFFTNTLSTLSSDIGYLVDMKAQTGQPMWEKNTAKSSVIYKISCHNERLSGWNPFTIEIDGEIFSTRIKTIYDFGAIYIHGTLRHWDFRITASGFGDEEQNEVQYGDFARAIQRSLYIP